MDRAELLPLMLLNPSDKTLEFELALKDLVSLDPGCQYAVSAFLNRKEKI